MRYEPLKGKEKFDAIFKSPDHILKSKNFNALIVINENKFSLGMILPKKNIKLAVNRNYLKRTVRNLSVHVFAESKVSLLVVSKKRILDFKKDKLRRELKTLLLNLTKKLNEENNYIFN